MSIKLDISQFRPCADGAAYYNRFPSFDAFWAACHRGDWMLWLADQLGVEHRLLVKAAARCANTVRHLMRDERSTAAVDAALQYADGELSREDMQEYADAAIDAFDDDDAGATWAAANAAAGAATWAAAAWAAAAAAGAGAAADAAAWAADAAARAANRRQTADICREVLTDAVMAAAARKAEKKATA